MAERAVAFRASADASLGAGRVDGELCWIGGASSGDASYPRVNMLPEATPPAFEGTPDDYVAANSTVEGFADQMRNKVRKCAQCGKPNAFTLSVCNACGDDLTKVEVGFTPNIFMGFVYGIQKGPFPYTISLRHQDESTIVFDDLLSLTPAHLNCVPTDVFIPDFRYLLLKPAEGLKVINRMFDSCFAVLKSQFLENDAFRKTLRGADKLTDDDFRELVVAGLNYPPSQYQLHLQFMLPPFLPFQWRQCLADVHFTPERFFPIRFVREVLDHLISTGETYSFEPDTPVTATIAHFKEKGLDYGTIHAAEVQRFFDSHRKLAQFDPAAFQYVTVGDQVFDMSGDAPKPVEVAANDVVNADKTALQNYGRPYGENGRPGGTYYKFAKKPSDVRTW